MAKKYFKNILFLRIVRIFFIAAGVFFIAVVAMAFTSLPFWGIHWLGTSRSELNGAPGTIVLLGGSGMPSESNLMRSWYTAKASASFPEARVLIAMPGDTTESNSTPQMMKQELVLRGVDSLRVHFENKGTNTRSQALHCAGMLDTASPLLLVTSPEHTRRAVLCFYKAGFETVYALPAFENAAEADLTYRDEELGGRKTVAPDVGENTSVRYQVWNHLKYEITFAREMAAILYYKLKGWI